MILSKKHIKTIPKKDRLNIPAEDIFLLPEKVLQFGTGVLLRGLPDYFIDKANKQGVFNGRIVMVKSTTQGATDMFIKQDNLYTQIVKGIKNGKKVDEAIINASVSRVLSAADQWSEILSCAANPQLQIVISNTTEVGITLLKDDNVHAKPPISFPGKLLAFLLERFKIFNGSAESGMVIIPAELITENGAKLKNILIELANINQLDENFIEWLTTANHFCNSLVDRIVPGKLSAADKKETEDKLGYKDDLMIMSEPYCLWAIETPSKKAEQILSFSKVDDGVIIVPDIFKYRELKLRLLNGSHTAACAMAALAGFTTVRQAMEDEAFVAFITAVMADEIAPAICGKMIEREEAKQFSQQVLDRFKNPFIEHLWLSISAQYTSKIQMRLVPVIIQYFNNTGTFPKHITLGFAAYILFMKPTCSKDSVFYGKINGYEYIINDDKISRLHYWWLNAEKLDFITAILQDKNLWETDLTVINGFAEKVNQDIALLQKDGAYNMLQKLVHQRDIY